MKKSVGHHSNLIEKSSVKIEWEEKTFEDAKGGLFKFFGLKCQLLEMINVPIIDLKKLPMVLFY